MRRLKHIGVDAFFAMRSQLLSDFEVAKQRISDDPVKTEHGNVGEAQVRNWLKEFLPKKFGVCKGYIITSNLNYAGPLEEWDIIIFDALESPILFTKGQGDGGESRRAIPIEYVRGVIEVKSSLNLVSAKKAVKKLKKLGDFIRDKNSKNYPTHFTFPFISSMIFLEVNIEKFPTYRNVLNKISEINQEEIIPFIGALVLKDSKNIAHSGYLKQLVGELDAVKSLEESVFEMSNIYQFKDGKYGCFGSITGYTKNSFPEYTFDLLSYLRGKKTNFKSSLYGLDFENASSARLFH